MRRAIFLAVFAALALAPSQASAATDYAAQAYNVLAPGQAGALPTTPNSFDQIKLYDGLTPLFDRVRAADLGRYFKREDFSSRGKVERTTNRRVRIVRDRYGVPHISATKRADLMFGAGWVTVEDRGLLLEFGRGPGRLAVLDAPGIDPFDVLLSARSFTPSPQAEAELTKQIELVRRSGPEGRQMLLDIDAYIRGANAYVKDRKLSNAPYTRNDMVALAAFIGSIFGGGGGGNEIDNADFRAQLEARLGAAGTAAWNDLTRLQDPESATSVPNRAPYNADPTGPTPGSPVIDAGSRTGTARVSPRRLSSNALLVAAKRSASGHPLAVMGPQLGYYYPEILMEIELHGGGIDFRGAAVPGLAMYGLLGRSQDYAWSLTSASGDNIDQVLEELCNADGSVPTAESTGYRFKGECRQMERIDAGVLGASGDTPAAPVRLRRTLHGPLQGTVTVGGKLYGVALQRTTAGRELLSILALKHMSEGGARTARDFQRIANEFEFTFNWHFVDDTDIAFFSSGRIPKRPAGADPRLPRLGTGDYEWKGFLSQSRHPRGINPPRGLILNWNNRPAPGWGGGDNVQSWGDVHRVDLFTGFKSKTNRLHDIVAVMNRAATQDLRAVQLWPHIAELLKGTPAPDARTQKAANLVSAWLREDFTASRLDRELDGKIDHPAAAILDATFDRMGDTILQPVIGDLTDTLADRIQSRDNAPSKSNGSSYGRGWYGYISKDLRTLLGKPVEGPYRTRFCGAGDLGACRQELWAAFKAGVDELAAAQGPEPNAWRADATIERIEFPPLRPEDRTMRWSNRPTFQQAIEFDGHRPRRR